MYLSANTFKLVLAFEVFTKRLLSHHIPHIKDYQCLTGRVRQATGEGRPPDPLREQQKDAKWKLKGRLVAKQVTQTHIPELQIPKTGIGHHTTSLSMSNKGDIKEEAPPSTWGTHNLLEVVRARTGIWSVRQKMKTVRDPQIWEALHVSSGREL